MTRTEFFLQGAGVVLLVASMWLATVYGLAS